jgi:hypothetical protein
MTGTEVILDDVPALFAHTDVGGFGRSNNGAPDKTSLEHCTLCSAPYSAAFLSETPPQEAPGEEE